MALLRTLCWALIFILRLRFPPGSSLASMLPCGVKNFFDHTRGVRSRCTKKLVWRHVKYIKREEIIMCVKFSIPVRGVSSFMDSSAGIGVGKCVRKTEYRSRFGIR